MSRFFVRPYEAGDEAAFTPRADMAAEQAALGWDWTRGPPGPTWTLARAPSGEVAGIGGGVRIARDRRFARVWALIADLPRRDWPDAVRCAGLVLGFLEAAGASTFTVLVREDLGGAARVMEHLGFTRSTPAPGWDGYVVMARGL